MVKWIIGLVIFIFGIGSLQAQDTLNVGQDEWVDSIFNSLSLEEKIGQLFMIRAAAKEDKKEIENVLFQVKKYGVGGICFFQGSPTQLAVLNNKYQKKSKIPMLISIDGEWGLGMRYPKKSISFPRALSLGAIQNNNIINEMGRHIADHCKRVGIHLNFAPVVDVNNNPLNPVINNRSFGEDKYNVAAKSYEYMKGMQENGVMACAKHFPGHGDTDTDSHLDLPIINHNRQRLDSIELMPFRSLIAQGVGSIMVAHLNIPALDNRKNRPTTLSKSAVTDLLRKELAFNGLIVTDAMEMKGVTKHFKPGEADKEAFIAGNDIILLPENIKNGIDAIKKGILDKTVPYERLENSVKKILRAKYIQGLTTWIDIPIEGIADDINNNKSLALKEELIENIITLATDEAELVPIKKIHDTKFVSIAVGAKKQTVFQNTISKYVDCTHLRLSKQATGAQKGKILKDSKDADYVIVSFHDMSKYATKEFGISKSSINFLKMLNKEKKVIIVLYGSPYALKYFDDFSTVVVSYDEDEMTQDITAQAIFGATGFKGKLPITASPKYNFGVGIYRASIGRIGYSIPERVGMSTSMLAGIDTIVSEMIKKKAAPGCQIIVVKNGKVVLDKAFGHFTYAKEHIVKTDDIYDMASVTKTCASTISLMRLYDEKSFDINAPIDRYIAEADTSNKGNISFQKILAHHGRLAGWIPFYKRTMDKSKKKPKPLPELYSTTLKPEFTIPVANNMFLRTNYKDSIWHRIFTSKLRKKADYRYSDLAFYIVHRTIKNLTSTPINEYAYDSFYKPLGLRRTDYLPLKKHKINDIAPTEDDKYFRNQIVRGHVHDMGAAMLGGVSGHAGLFSNAKEIATIYQMLLNGGSYGGVQYLKPETIKLFTTRYFKSTRRGLGFDLKELNESRSQNMSHLASEKTFGHLGFTGICAFADPVHDLVYVFVSNRTFPNMKNNKFGKYNYRPRVQSQIYRSMGIDNITP
ncbi:MAG: glycoside hydrolase family 3 N-terminal domain-containing protein [Saprospiraceae bacterium]